MARFIRIVALVALAALAVWIGLRFADTPPPPPGKSAFVRAAGTGLVLDGAPFRFQAIGFANDYSVGIGDYGFTLAGSPHHDARDVERIADIGFNAIRFAINGSWLRDDPPAFWRWLDRNIGWARAQGVKLILDLHVPIGGDWLDASTGAGDFRIWTDPEIRAQNVDFWRAVATRYRDEPVIAAYDILNEPVTADATGDGWRRLAAEMVAAIRAVDPNHLIIVGPVYGTEQQYRPIGQGDQFLVDDDNVMYDFHFYEPIAFTHQTAGWLARPIPDGGRYPDPEMIVPTGAQVLLPDAMVSGPALPPGDTDWRRYESDWGEITDPRAVAALPIATMRAGAVGRVWFDDIAVEEQDPEDGSTHRIVEAPMTAVTIEDWWQWGNADPATVPSSFARDRTEGADDGASLRIDGAVGPDGYLGWSSDLHWFRVTPGHRYRISGQMRGEGVRYGPDGAPPGFIGLALDVYADPGPDDPGFLTRGPAYLEALFLDLARFGFDHDVPISVMEFGTIRETFAVEGKGGTAWISDMLALFDRYEVSYALWNYHGPAMGLYLTPPDRPPARPNQPLIDTLEAHFRRSGG